MNCNFWQTTFKIPRRGLAAPIKRSLPIFQGGRSQLFLKNFFSTEKTPKLKFEVCMNQF